MENQKVLDVLNNLEVFEQNGGDDPYMLAEITPEVERQLNEVGVSTETLKKYGDDETFCILALAFGEGYSDDFEKGGLVNKEEQFTKLLDEMGDALYNGKIMRAGSKRNALIGMFKKELFRDA